MNWGVGMTSKFKFRPEVVMTFVPFPGQITWSGALIYSLRLNGAELCDSVSYQVCGHVQEAIFVQSPGEYP